MQEQEKVCLAYMIARITSFISLRLELFQGGALCSLLILFRCANDAGLSVLGQDLHSNEMNRANFAKRLNIRAVRLMSGIRVEGPLVLEKTILHPLSAR